MQFLTGEEGAFFGKNCPFPHAPIPEKTFALVMSPVPAAVRRAGMALCSRHGHEGEREKTLEGRSMVSGFFRGGHRERARLDVSIHSRPIRQLSFSRCDAGSYG